jgi:hypothetical protein
VTVRVFVATSVMLAACASSADHRASVRADTATVVASAVESTTAARQAEPARAAQDTVRGVIESVGSEPVTQLILRQHDGSTCAVHAAPRVLSASVAGLEVTLWGALTNSAPPMLPGATCAISATRYAVRAADGVPTVDGVLRADGARFWIEFASGERRALRDVPAVLRRRVGARIFWAGPLDRAPSAYGVLQEARP